MKNTVFLTFMLALFAGFIAFHGWLTRLSSPVPVLQLQVERAEDDRKRAELKAMLVESQLAEYQQQVATLLPTAIRSAPEAEVYPLRRLASVAGRGEEMLSIERASGLFEKAKARFRDKQFEESNSIIEDLIVRFPDSVHVIEAHFLLAEGRFQLGEYEGSVDTIEKMIEVFPESELTGFALLRLGRIFENQDRLEDASDIYRSVLSNFKNHEIVKQAQISLKQVAL